MTWYETWGILLNLMQVRIFSKVLLGFAKKKSGDPNAKHIIFCIFVQVLQITLQVSINFAFVDFQVPTARFHKLVFSFPKFCKGIAMDSFLMVVPLHSDSLRAAL